MGNKSFILSFGLFFTSLIVAMEQPPKNATIELISSDNQKITLPLNVALQSPTLADSLKNFFNEGKDKSITFTTIDGETLTTVVQIMKAFYKHHDIKGEALLKAVEKETPVYDSQAILLLRAFDFLDFMPGVRLVARYLSMHSSVTKSKSYGATTFLKQLLYGAPIMDHVIILIKTNQLTYNTINEIGRIYYLIMNKDISEFDRVRWGIKSPTIINEDRLTFSLRDYLDYFPEIIRKRHKSDMLVDAGSLDLHELKLADLDGLQDISGIHNITDLELSNNKLTSLPNLSLQGLNNLKRLTIIGGQLKELPITSLRGLKKLEYLSISFQPVTTIPAGIFQGLTNLKALVLYHNQLSELPSTLFDDLYNLEDLALTQNQLSCLSPVLFKNLNKLKTLSLSFNQLTELPATLFDNLSYLHKLDLGSNQLKNLAPLLFKKLISLKRLNLSGNQLSNQNIQELRNALPQAKIYLDYSHWFSDN